MIYVCQTNLYHFLYLDILYYSRNLFVFKHFLSDNVITTSKQTELWNPALSVFLRNISILFFLINWSLSLSK